jgi:hypothetical protein
LNEAHSRQMYDRTYMQDPESKEARAAAGPKKLNLLG